MPPRSIPVFLVLALPAMAHALCTSDKAAPATAVLERFISADCATCWQDPATVAPGGPGTVVLDWVVPGRQGDDAPLATVASRDAVDRLAALRRPAPEKSDAVTARRQGKDLPLRLAQGAAFNDYLAASIELKAPGRTAWQAWLLLVEQLPAGTEGSPVPRNLVRNVFRPDWDRVPATAPARLAESRSMQIHEGARPDRLRLVAVLQDARGHIRAISRTECSE